MGTNGGPVVRTAGGNETIKETRARSRKDTQSARAVLAAATALGVSVAVSEWTGDGTTSRNPAAPAAGYAFAAEQEPSPATGSAGWEALKAMKGREFDVAYLSQMIAHHEAAVTMARQALKAVRDAKTRTEASKVITAQTGEIRRMTGWLKSWYGAVPSARQEALVRREMGVIKAMPVTSARTFYEMMIPHHQEAVATSELALTHGGRPEVRRLASQIIRDQNARIAAYRRALAAAPTR